MPATTEAGPKPPSRALLAGLLVDAQGERLTPLHAVKKGRRYRYYISVALITAAAKEGCKARGLPLRNSKSA
jgi:hypothetical protein